MASSPSDGTDAGTRRLDVREIDGAPFGEVSRALDALARDERLLLVSDFEPVPLYDVLDERGLVHETTRTDGTYRVEIRHGQPRAE